ncbi:MAG TPA: hypothetical protein VFM65_01100 [Flavobacteriaceae bacterium]|nr:hypothetical protein [Flavobacteriaceae bacterium]
MNFSSEHIETELQNRWKYPYQWGKRQNDEWDKFTNFIYETETWESLVEKMKNKTQIHQLDKNAFFQYAANRWYNFWSAVAVEKIFTEIRGVEPALNHKNRLVDFSIFGINFDHKTSVFPKGFGQTLHYAQTHTEEMLYWLYKNQSQQGRKHHENRLFIIVFNSNGEHWKLKAEISWLKSKILDYVATFEASKLTKLEFPTGKTAVSDIIWAIK